MDVHWLDGPQPRIVGGVGEGRNLEATRPGAATEGQRDPRRKARSSSRFEGVQLGTFSFLYFISLSIILSYNLKLRVVRFIGTRALQVPAASSEGARGRGYNTLKLATF